MKNLYEIYFSVVTEDNLLWRFLNENPTMSAVFDSIVSRMSRKLKEEEKHGTE